MQGAYDRKDYRTAMNVCLNGFPLETGAWCRRSGTRLLAHTRNGAPGRVVTFDFKQRAPYEIEFTAGYMRFFSGTSLVGTNDALLVVSVSAADPAVITTATHGWSTGNQVQFIAFGTVMPLLQGRQFLITVLSSTTFSIADAITGDTIDGATLGTFTAGNPSVQRIYEIGTPYTGTLWQDIRLVPADIPTTNATTPGGVILHGSIKPYVLQVATAPTDAANATFTMAAAVFKDGPYFDPVGGGTLATPSAKKGNITLTLSFPAYDSSKSYSIGDYALSSSVNYKSLTDANVGNTPVSSPTNWVAASAADAVGPHGFTAADVGRMVRLYSEPAVWVAGTTYSAGTVVAYGGAGLRYDGSSLGYWTAIVGSNTGNIPGVDLTKWALTPTAQAAIWSWGRITGLSNTIDRALSGSTSIGNMTAGGGLSAVFDGNLSQAATACAELATTGTGAAAHSTITRSSYAGKNYASASDQTIAQAIVYPSSDNGLAFGTYFSASTGNSVSFVPSITLNLRGKASLPASASDGTLLATSGFIANTTAPITLISTDQATAWKYVWVEQITTGTIDSSFSSGAYSLMNAIGELVLVSPTGSGASTSVTVAIAGDDLLYTTAVRTWRLGIYSDALGWPTCGTYHEGRLWLSGSIPNRIDSSKSNDIFNFAPTDPTGAVAGNNAISYTFNAPDINPIFWMVPDDNGIVCGTQAGEWLVRATQANLPLTPTTTQAHRVTTNKCANIEPRRTGLTLAVVQAYKRKVLEYFADIYSGRFTAHNLALTAKHLTKSGVLELAYQHELVPTLWARRADGVLVGATYKRESLISSQPPDFCGWHRHTLGSGRSVESICIGGNADGSVDTLIMVTNDSTTGIRHVEMMMPAFEEDDDLEDAFFLDDAIVPTAYSSTTDFKIYGLWPLNGQEVAVFAGGLDLGDFTVTDGTITVTFGDGIEDLFTASFVSGFTTDEMPVVVGFVYNGDGQLVRPAQPTESGTRKGPSMGEKRRTSQFSAMFSPAINASVNFGTVLSDTAGVMRPIAITSAGGTVRSVLSPFSGIYQYSGSLGDDWSLDSMLAWRITRPFPLIIPALQGFVSTSEK